MDRYKVCAAFDSETTNYGNPLTGVVAYSILYQFGYFDCLVQDINPDNVKQTVTVRTYRKIDEFTLALENYMNRKRNFVPVVLVHNLGFDMYFLAQFFKGKKIKALAKTARKPISFQVLDENDNPKIVFLDTLGLFMKSLAVLGQECGMPKLSGEWDYNLIRTPDTPLTENELEYAKGDLYTLICYMGYFLRQNPDINASMIGLRIQTKTGVVRAKRMEHIGGEQGKRLKFKVRQYWHLNNKSQVPKTDDELFTMHAATRGGFTFCASNNASKVFFADDEMNLESYDATSQHPAQMVSHLYPIDFSECEPERMQIAFDTAITCSLDRVLNKWLKPFPYAFYGSFTFENLRPKAGSIFEHEGIYPLSYARINSTPLIFENQVNAEFKSAMGERGYKDACTGGKCLFGKVESADIITLYLTELESWILSRCYEWDSVTSNSGYMTSTFRKASDMSVLSVMRFYKAKNVLKEFMHAYNLGSKNDASMLNGLYPQSFVDACAKGEADKQTLKEYYQLSKADLNALFGIEATNECRRDFELGRFGLELTGSDGLHNMPKTPKCNYQYGQRIVGWSRIAQTCIMELISPYVSNIICGDTDSLKLYYSSENKNKIDKALRKHAKAIDKAKKAALARVRLNYPTLYDPLDEIGYYVFDGSYQALCASWNKCYIVQDESGIHCTIAGIPSSRRIGELGSLNDWCDSMLASGMGFEELASLVVGYNVTIDHSITKLNARLHPAEWGMYFEGNVTDYLGKTVHVQAPQALALYPTPKTIGDTSMEFNARNLEKALKNNPKINYKPAWIKWENGKAVIER